MIEDDMDSFMERNLNMQLSTRDVLVPCNLTLSAVKQIEQLFEHLVEFSPSSMQHGSRSPIAVVSSVQTVDAEALKQLISCVSSFFHSPVSGPGSWMDVLISDQTDSNPLKRAMASVTGLNSVFDKRKQGFQALVRLGHILDRIVTETFASSILHEKHKFAQHVSNLRSKILPECASPQIHDGDQDSVNWEVFTLDLLLNRNDLYTRIRRNWKPFPPSFEALQKWFSKFEIMLSCLVMGTESYADIIVDMYRCAPQLLETEALSKRYKERVHMVKDVLGKSLTDLVQDPSELDLPDGVRFIPKALVRLYNDELDLVDLLRDGVWKEVSCSIIDVGLRQFVPACDQFSSKAQAFAQDWRQSGKQFAQNRDAARKGYWGQKVKDAEADYIRVTTAFKKEEEEWRARKDRFDKQVEKFREAKSLFEPLLKTLLTRARMNQNVQELAAAYADIFSRKDVGNLLLNENVSVVQLQSKLTNLIVSAIAKNHSWDDNSLQSVLFTLEFDSGSIENRRFEFILDGACKDSAWNQKTQKFNLPDGIQEHKFTLKMQGTIKIKCR